MDEIKWKQNPKLKNFELKQTKKNKNFLMEEIKKKKQLVLIDTTEIQIKPKTQALKQLSLDKIKSAK